MCLFVSNENQENDDNVVRQIRSAKMATRKQCVRLIQIAGTAMGVYFHLTECMMDDANHPKHVAGEIETKAYNDWKLARWTKLIGAFPLCGM